MSSPPTIQSPVRQRWRIATLIIRDALLIALFFSSLGLVANLFHPERVPYFADGDYEILVPCPEPGGDVTAVEAGDPMLGSPETLLVDARLAEEYATWKLRDAMNVPYDYLDPTPPEILAEVAKRIARSRAKRVVVYGDGDQPDTGEQLGKEISASGIKNVFFVTGGAPALRHGAAPGGDR